MPETPTPGVNGQVFAVPAAHDSRSISSLEPAATTLGSLASMATAGSFCLFCENGVAGLPTDTMVSVVCAEAATVTVAPMSAVARAASDAVMKRGLP